MSISTMFAFNGIGPFSISTQADLNQLAQDINGGTTTYAGKVFILTSDIVLTGNFTPIGKSAENSFQGRFSGNGHKISGLNVSSLNDNAGLFGYIKGATIDSLSVEGTIAGVNNVGGIVGYCDMASVTNSCFNGSVTGSGNFVGGIVGYGYSPIISNCYNVGSINSSEYAGGIIGGSNYYSRQLSAKTININSNYFPGITVVGSTFNLNAGDMLVTNGGVPVSADDFANGIPLIASQDLVISQNSTEKVRFTPTASSAGVKIKITGIGSTNDLCAKADTAQGIYSFGCPSAFMPAFSKYLNNNPANVMESFTLQGRINYQVQRSNEGWSTHDFSQGNSYYPLNNNTLYIYEMGNPIPVVTFANNPAGYGGGVHMDLFPPIASGSTTYKPIGNGNVFCWYPTLDGAGSKSDRVWNGENRTFRFDVEWKLYVGAGNPSNTDVTAFAATDDQANQLLAGTLPLEAGKYIVLKVTDPGKVITGENFYMGFTQKAGTTGTFGFEGVTYNTTSKTFTITGSMVLRDH